MPLPSWCQETITVRRAPFTVDRYGNPTAVRNWSAAVDHSVSGCSVQPIQGLEDLEDRDAVVNRWIVYSPIGSDILPGDRVIHRGLTYEVNSELREWTGATGNLDSTQVFLERVAG